MTGTPLMNYAEDGATVGPSHVPESLRRKDRVTLITADVLVIFSTCLLAFSNFPNGVGAALLTAIIIAAIAASAHLYDRSFAVYPRDEAYYACGCVALAAVPAALLVTGIGNIPLGVSALALALAALGSSVVRVRLHLQRRPDFTPFPGLQTITRRGWERRQSPWNHLLKRSFDLVVATLTLILAAPVMLGAALAILVESGRPVFFRQERVGENGKIFWILKFRTMTSGAGSEWVRPGDTRITRAGAFLRRTSIDELPQLFNVFFGQMSIVGPRPEMVEFARSFAQTIRTYPQRHVVSPGITGWAQLYFKRNLTPEDIADVLPYDLFYVEHGTIVMDCALILKTICEVLFHRAV